MGTVVGDTSLFVAFKNEVTKIPQVTALAGTRHHIGFGYRNVIAETQGIKKRPITWKLERIT